jgi:hypothetical protein
MTNSWISEEEKIIESDMRKNKKKKTKENSTMFKFLFFIGIISILTYANASLRCPSEIETKRFWGETWICPNPDCGYENYEAVDYCGICGAFRYGR